MNILCTTTNPEVIRKLAQDPNLTPAQLFVGKADGHKFKPGDVCTLTGLLDFPEFNGDKVTIDYIREDGPRGKAYYISGSEIPINWVYEYRLQL